MKLFTNVRPTLSGIVTPFVSLGLGVDFDRPRISTTATLIDSIDAGKWGDKETATGGKWGDKETASGAKWGGGRNITKSWQSVTGMGYAASLRIRATSASDQIEWKSTTYVYVPGGLL